MAVWIVLLGVAMNTVAYGKEKSRPMAEMHGGCSEYKMDIKEELKAWDKKPIQLARGDTPLPLASRLALTLEENEKVTFLQKPEKTSSAKGKSYAGLFELRPAKSGILKIAAGSKLWFDLVDKASTKIVPATEFEMQTDCPKIYKMVTFQVEGGKTYAVQVSGSKEAKADFLFSLK